MIEKSARRIVLTGGPGAGKTAVLEILSANGFSIGKDIARTIIRERKAAGLSPRPAPKDFAGQILAREIARYEATESECQYVERGVAEAIAFLFGAGGLTEAAAVQLMARYPYDQILLFPPWAEIYCTDTERDHTFDHSVRVHDSTRDWYIRFGYQPIEVPLGPEQVRAEFVLSQTNPA